MAINPLSVPNFSVTPYSGGADFSQLANLGNVYQEGQMQNRRLAVLGQLGQDPTQNAMLMIKSGDPTMAQHGIELMNTVQQQQRQNALLGIQQSQEQRAQQEFKQQDPNYRLQKWIEGHPKGDPQSPEAQAYAYNQPALLKLEKPESEAQIRDQREAWAKTHGYPAEVSSYYGATGKMPGTELSAHEETAADTADKEYRDLTNVVNNIKRMKQLSTTAWGGKLGLERAKLAVDTLGDHAPQGAKDAMELNNLGQQNTASQARGTFGSRLAAYEVQLLQKTQTGASQSDVERQRIYNDLEPRMQALADNAQERANRIRSRTLYKPGGAVPYEPTPPGTAAVPTAPASAKPAPTPTAPIKASSAPTLKEFMDRARVNNPNVSDKDLAQYWKKEYGGG
jgi:hypothetical protein